MNVRLTFALLAAIAAPVIFAQEEGESSSDGAEATENASAVAEGDEAASIAEMAGVKKAPVKVFAVLPRCTSCKGHAEVRKPKSQGWEPLSEGRYYPLGSSYRTLQGGSLVIQFGRNITVSADGDSVFGTRLQALSNETRAVTLESGTIRLSLPENMKEGLFTVAAPGFTVRNPAGDSSYAYRQTGDGDEAVIRCITGTVSIEGRHFAVPAMRVSNQFRIRSSHDNLETILYGEAGDFILRLDSGVVVKTKIDENGNVEHLDEPSYLDWHLSPETRVLISRAVPSIGQRLSVTVMTFDSRGELKNQFAFAEGRTNVNSGELAKSALDAKQAEIAKRAAEAAGAAQATEADAGETSDGNNEGNQSEKESEQEEE